MRKIRIHPDDFAFGGEVIHRRLRWKRRQSVIYMPGSAEFPEI